MRVALATCRELPEEDPDEEPLVEALRQRGVTAELVAWDDDTVDLSRHRACVLRSTWNYYHALERFLAWAKRAAACTRLFNPLPVVQWNAHKRYLRDLAARGVPVVPTEWIDPAAPRSLATAMDALSADDVVVKPAVSAASFATRRIDRARMAEGEAHLSAVLARCEAMVQPYVSSVEGYGERSLVWIAGELTHAIRKSPRFGGEHERVSPALPIEDDERALAERALAEVEGPLLYARVDVARDASGTPRIMELELLEPSLFLRQSPRALERFAGAIAACARGEAFGKSD